MALTVSVRGVQNGPGSLHHRLSLFSISLTSFLYFYRSADEAAASRVLLQLVVRHELIPWSALSDIVFMSDAWRGSIGDPPRPDDAR